MSELTPLSANKMHGGWQKRFKHASQATQCDMTFSIFLPELIDTKKCPVVYCLAGLTCTDENFTQKSGAQRIANELGLVLVMPDTSPRGESVPNDDYYGLGQGAGFYLNATQAPWSLNFNMYDYVVHELPTLIAENFNVSPDSAIMGHSMGGHGALMIGLKNTHRYASASALAPIVNPSEIAWGQKALTAYLGSDTSAWQQYDSCYLMEHAAAQTNKIPLLIDQGAADEFYPAELQFEKLQRIARTKNWPLSATLQTDYDHSYYFVSSFVEKHLRFHAKQLS